jgi:hypothetical protein
MEFNLILLTTRIWSWWCLMCINVQFSYRTLPEATTTFSSKEEILSYLDGFDGINATIVSHDPVVNIPINIEHLRALTYVECFRNGNLVRRDWFERALWKTVNQVRMLHAYNQCWEQQDKLLQRKRQEQNARENYDLYVRMGDDSVLSRPIDAHSILDFLRNSSSPSGDSSGTSNNALMLISYPCNNTRGYAHDQIDFMSSSDAAQTYFSLPYAGYYAKGVFNARHSTCITVFAICLPQWGN